VTLTTPDHQHRLQTYPILRFDSVPDRHRCPHHQPARPAVLARRDRAGTGSTSIANRHCQRHRKNGLRNLRDAPTHQGRDRRLTLSSCGTACEATSDVILRASPWSLEGCCSAPCVQPSFETRPEAALRMTVPVGRFTKRRNNLLNTSPRISDTAVQAVAGGALANDGAEGLRSAAFRNRQNPRPCAPPDKAIPAASIAWRCGQDIGARSRLLDLA